MLRKQAAEAQTRFKGEESKRLAAEDLAKQKSEEAGRLASLVEQNKMAGLAAVAAGPPLVRVALVIGNSKYEHVGVLTNPKNDAGAVAGALRRLKFNDVTELHNLGRRQLIDALRDFEAKAKSADWALVFFAGHGVRPRLGYDDYLIPTDAKLSHEKDLSDDAVSLEQVLRRIAGARQLQIVLFDACRDNPLTRRLSAELSPQRALRQAGPSFESPRLIYAFAARRGSTADDGVGSNSPFTEALVANLEADDLDVAGLLNRMYGQVMKTTNNRQVPEIWGAEHGRGHAIRVDAAR